MSRMTLTSLVLAVVMVAGCQSSKDNGAVSEVPGPTPSKPISAASDPYFLEPAPGPAPIASGPVRPAEPTPSITLGAPARSAPLTPPAIGAGNYTVRQGDTLWSIARSRYGDGQKWKTIVSANPGLTPEKMKIGQTISLP
ncbi:MAG: LysM peptidoglycan-binding domain-containing protein [Phycisphaeraceae bacterium]